MNRYVIFAVVLVFALVSGYLIANEGLFAESPQKAPEQSSAQQVDENLVKPGGEPAVQRDPATKFYESKALGVRFYYLPPHSYELTVEESGNKISLAGKEIEVFNKSPNMTFADAIKERFLKGYSEQDCYVKVSEPPPTEPQDMIEATISYKNDYKKCPERYTTTARIYFLYNTNVPDKYLFVDLGQDSIASDGLPRDEWGGNDWSRSIEIF